MMDQSEGSYGLTQRALRLLALLVLSALLAAVVFSALGVERLPGFSGTVFSDFDLFHSAARLTLEGRLVEVYDYASFQKAQADIGAPVHDMTWTYPPPFDLVIAPLGWMRSGLAYLVFALTSFGFFLWALYVLAGRYFTLALLAAVPAILITLRTGQNGTLLAGIAALSCHFALTKKDWRAGGALGLMVIKPHLALGLGLWALVARRWVMAGFSVALAVVVCAISFLILGGDVWHAFLEATKEASGFLAEGLYPHFRMASVYSSFRSLGAGADLAFAAQIFAALIGLAAIVIAALRFETRAALIVVLFLTPSFSPYMYDYDLVIYGPGFALLLAEFDRIGRRFLVLPAMGLAWVAGGTGLVQNTRGGAEGLVAQGSLAGLAALALGLYAFVVFWDLRAKKPMPLAEPAH